MSSAQKVVLAAALVVCGAGAVALAASSGLPSESRVREAMLRLYIHGVNDALAERVVGREAVPALRRLLIEPGFPRRDNVVAFLAHLDDGAATQDLVDLLAVPPAGVSRPEEDRALLLAPQALGRIAARGDRAALEALLQITQPGGDGGVASRAAAWSDDPDGLRTDLIEMALDGLALSGAPEARARLEAIARPGSWPVGSLRRDLAPLASGRLQLMAPAAAAVPSGSTLAAAAPPVSTQAPAPGGTGSNLFDTSTIIHRSPLDYANHVEVSSPMSDDRLDDILAEANVRAGRADFIGDVACCIQLARSGNAQVFGSVGDGLDVINTVEELLTVLADHTPRAKVVRLINTCDTPGTNIIGCGWAPGFGMAVVRVSSPVIEAVLWIHEYGHNTGLFHSPDSRALMFSGAALSSNGLTQAECNSYHTPHPTALIIPEEGGVCADTDSDDVANHLDNCPAIYNVTQADYDTDQMGDDCDPDDDNDQVDDGLDCASLDRRLWAPPGEAADLTVTESSGVTQLDWTAPAAPGASPAFLFYDVVQAGSPDGFLAGATCMESDGGPDTTATLAPLAEPIWAMSGSGWMSRLGAAVARAGRVDGDGFVDLLVGAPAFSNGQNREGRAQIHYGSLAGPYGAASWAAEGGVAMAASGSAVASAGDINGDGFDDILIGAPSYDDGVTAGGVVFLHHGGLSGPSSAPSTTLSAGQPGALFGQSVAGAGDVNHDGFDDVIVGAPLYDDAFSNEGRAFVYLGSAAGLSPIPVWTASGGQDDAWFGASVAGAGDVNGDSFHDVIVGAPMFDNGEPNEGALFVFHGSAAGPSVGSSWSFESDQMQAQLGGAVACAGRVLTGPYDAVIAGARYFDNGENDEGVALLFSGSAAGLSLAPVWDAEGDQPGAALGAAVGSAGDFNGDGVDDVVVGAPGSSGSVQASGQVRVYLGGPGGVEPVAAITIAGDQQDSLFGAAVAGVGDVLADGRGDILVGAPGRESFLPDEGFAFVYPGSASLKPSAGQSFYYLIRAENLCGDGGIGRDSSGAPRQPAISCP